MIDSTLCYIERDGCYLMLYRNKKAADPCEGKWVGVGGKFEPGESPDECLLREVFEETGLRLTKYEARGVITFLSDRWPEENMYLYTATEWEGELTNCSEGELAWIPKNAALALNLWEGDVHFIRRMIAGEKSIRIIVYEMGK